MPDNDDFQLILNKLTALEDKFTEIESITKILNLWAKENDYELIPIVNMLNNKTLLKILSILIALGMWIMVVSGHEETKEMTVPVKLINVSGGKVAIYRLSKCINNNKRCCTPYAVAC